MALLTEGRWAGGTLRITVLLALGLVLALGAARLLGAGDARRAREAAAPERALRQARDQQAATAEILGAMAVSPPDLQRVLDTIARNAARVCDGPFGAVFRFDGTRIHLAAHHGLAPTQLDALNRQFPISLDDTSPTAQAVRQAAVVHYSDVPSDPALPSSIREIARAVGYRSLVAVPLLREGRVLGTLNAARPAGGFSERQIQLLRTFADQAVIAIENVRLFTELEARNRDLTEALEQQTATGEVLGVIARTRDDVGPVFEMILENAMRLAGAEFGGVFRLTNGLVHVAAMRNPSPGMAEAMASYYPRPLEAEGAVTRAIREREVVHIADTEEASFGAAPRDLARVGRFRSQLTVPLLRNGVALGAIAVGGPKPGLLSNAQVAVIRTFADQAVIAIENVRLFTALETRNHELSESLEQQTATAEILGVISRSPTDTQPVFDGIVASAVRLCDARMGAIYRIDHDVIDVVATADMNDEARETHQAPYPMPVADLQLPFRRAIATGERLHVVDVDTELGFSESFRERARTLGYRSALMVPMCREGRVIGTINVGRIGAGGVPRPFSDREIGLLQTFADQAVIAIENVRLFQELEARNRELTESLEQQTATSEILRVISSSPTDLLPVFDAILRSVVTLCAGYYSLLFLFDGERLDLAATHNVPPDGLDALKRRYPMSIGSDEGGLTAQAVRERRLLHVTDLQSDPRVPAGARLASEAVGQRAAVAVPMFRKDEPVGALTVSRQDPRAFSERELALLQTFAAQAVIAIENVRLFQELETRNRELSEALEQQTATAEILGVISRSPTDLQPVLNAVARNASRLCGAANVSLYRIEGNLMRKVAEEGLALTMLRVGEARPITRTTISGRALVDRTTIHLPDYQSPEAVRDYPDVRRDTGIRTTIGIPLLREGIAIGAFTAYRTEPRAFAEREIALLQTFADQAVIAIENVRLFQELEARNRELTESLEQQTATGEILRVISSSPTDFAPVMTAVTQNAARLARADHALIGEAAEGRIRWLATSGCPLVSEGPSISRQLPSGRAILDCQTTQVEDVTDLTVDFPGVRRAYEEFGVRTILATPLVREGQAIGVLLVRRTRVQPFTGKEVELLRTFADQAVIAIENVRLFTELEARNRELTESLEQQTATSEILGAISASPTDVQPVFDTIVESVARLCDGVYTTLFRFDGELIYPAAYHRSIGPEGQGIHERMYPRPPSRDSVVARAVLDRAVVRVADIEKDADVPSDTRELARTVGYQSVLAVPMLREGTPIGALGIGRRSLAGRVRPFSEREIALVRTFADQAVIAIENVRLFQELAARNRELTEALEQQTATSEILRVISRSPTDVQPVFDSISASAVRLCGGLFGSIYLLDGELVDLVGTHNLPASHMERFKQGFPARPHRGLVGMRAILDGVVVQASDVASDPEFQNRELADAVGMRSIVAVPMLRDGKAIGALSVGRRAPGLFPASLVGLLKTFADQAVIAIENVRLFRELEARNRELTESLEQQTATAEILRVISSSPTNTQPVFDAIVASAVRLCDGRSGSLYRIEDGVIHQVAYVNPIEEAHSAYRAAYPKPLEQADPEVRRHYLEGTLAHVEDVDAEPGLSEEFRVRARTSGYRSVVSVPMFREGRVVGTLAVARAGPHRSPRPFSDREIRLLQTFAAQAVIAIENVRLFQELETRNRDLSEALEQQTATSEILRVISRSPTDIQPVFDSILARAIRLADGLFGATFSFDGELLHLVAHHGVSDEALAFARRVYPMAPGREQLAALAVLEKRVVHLRDVDTDADVPEKTRQFARVIGFQSLLAVPMLREDHPVGVLVITRAAGEFSTRHIELVKTFADQAVIAIENVRLFRELEARNRELTEALEQQTATSEILRAISASPTDTQPVFDTIAQRAFRVCDGSHCTVFQFDGTLIHLVAHHGQSADALEVFRQAYPVPPDADTMVARSIRQGVVVHNPDLLTDPSDTVRRISQTGGYRTGVIVPMLRSGRAVGAIGVGRSGPDGAARPYTEKEIALLTTFADQGVIAVENVRLFRELEARTRELARSVEELQALSEVGRAVSSTLDLPTVLATIVTRAVQLSGTNSGVLYEYDEATRTFHLQASHQTETELVEALRASPIQLGEGATGQAVARRAPVQVTDILEDREFRFGQRAILTRLGYRSILSIPLLLEQRILGGLTVSRREPGSFPPETVNLLQTFATQSALAIQNARLFREIEAKGRELEVASRHKSQFLANMSHELRTPLNAILGYTELLIDGIYGDLSPKTGDVMARIDRSGKHLLGLINDVLDLSKIEAGQLELALADYALAEVVHAVVTQVESLAAEKGLLLQATVAPDLPAGRGDERRLAQVLLNLVGNALKFTEVGSVRIAAYRHGDAFVVSVADTGPGIAEADRQRIFEEFQQADSSSTRKKGGTGLGLSIARRIVELHGGRIWVESTVGRGSTFSFQVPVRVERQVGRA